MRILGLTGSIGMGKSSLAAMLQNMGIPVHDADNAVHQALSPRGKGFEIVAVSFPECWDKKNHVIRRDILADIVFDDDNKRQELENILHPLVQNAQKQFLAKCHNFHSKIAVLEIPLLFETGAQNRVDQTLVASAPYFLQRKRVLTRPHMSEEKFLKILNTQMPDEEKRARADYVIPTGLGFAHSFHVLKQALRDMQSRI